MASCPLTFDLQLQENGLSLALPYLYNLALPAPVHFVVSEFDGEDTADGRKQHSLWISIGI